MNHRATMCDLLRICEETGDLMDEYRSLRQAQRGVYTSECERPAECGSTLPTSDPESKFPESRAFKFYGKQI